ncbi:hypothetical protein ACFQ51_44145 [Streptomyces kaempferi]
MPICLLGGKEERRASLFSSGREILGMRSGLLASCSTLMDVLLEEPRRLRPFVLDGTSPCARLWGTRDVR